MLRIFSQSSGETIHIGPELEVMIESIGENDVVLNIIRHTTNQEPMTQRIRVPAVKRARQLNAESLLNIQRS